MSSPSRPTVPPAVDTPDTGVPERAAIVAAATDYIESWLDGDAERMRGCLHPELAKRELELDRDGGPAALVNVGATDMIDATAAGLGRRHPRGFEVTIFDVARDIASVGVTSVPYVDYLHLARLEGRWLIVNVLWRRRDDAPRH